MAGAQGWLRANAAGGANVNLLASSRPEDQEALAGMAKLDGIPAAHRREQRQVHGDLNPMRLRRANGGTIFRESDIVAERDRLGARARQR